MITGVKMTQDLKLARIYFSVFGEMVTREEALKGLKRARGFVKYSLGRRLELRYIPELEFFYDESFDYGERIDKLLLAVKSENEPNHTPIKK